jgi:cytoskeletal protein RodZ
MDPNREPLRKIPIIPVPQVNEDIGSKLKKKREAKGHSLDAVSRQTRIPKRFLEALEKNQLDEFPALVYLRGFLKNYCDFLELDFDSIWTLVEPPPAPSPERPKASAAPLEQAAKAKGSGAPAHKETAPSPDKSSIAAFVFAVALALATAFYVRKPAPDALPAASEVPANLASYTNQAEHVLSITFEREAWVSLKSDGELLFEGKAPEGARQEWKAKRSFSLRTPQPQNLSLALDAAPYRLPQPQTDGEYKIE